MWWGNEMELVQFKQSWDCREACGGPILTWIIHQVHLNLGTSPVPSAQTKYLLLAMDLYSRVGLGSVEGILHLKLQSRGGCSAISATAGKT